MLLQVISDKENLRPSLGLNLGNNISKHPGTTGKSAGQLRTQFESDCQAWEAKLSEAAESDPMAVWDSYIRWAQQNIALKPTHCSSLLKRCTQQYQSSERYKGDPRYLRVWIKYIDTVEQPLETFAHLERCGIGSDLALFYTSWSLVLELKKASYAEAYSKLEDGIKRRARPPEQLQNALKQFEQRMSKRTMDALKNAAATQPIESVSVKPSSSAPAAGDVLRGLLEPKEPAKHSVGRAAAAAGMLDGRLEFSKPPADEPSHFLCPTADKPHPHNPGS